MKTASRILSLLLAAALLLGALSLSGCAGGAEPAAPAETPSEAPDEAPQETPAAAPAEELPQGVLPVLSIETKSREANVTDFVTAPVAEHVSEEIASWTPDYVRPPFPYYEECTVSLRSGEGSILLEGCDAKVKVRGNWTTNYPKKPLRIKFAEKQNLLGLNDGAAQKNWLLLAEYKDASMLRNKVALSIAREILGQDGLYAADADFVQVELNGEYWGLYLLTDMQQVSAHRVNITEPKKDYLETDIGYFLEYDGYFVYEDELHSFALDFADNAPLRCYDGSPDGSLTVLPLPASEDDPQRPVGISIKSRINSPEQHDFIENFVNKVYRILYEAAYHDKAFVFDEDYRDIRETNELTPQQAVEAVVDVQSLVDMYIVSELTCDADIYWSSFYMDADFGPEGDKKLRFEAPWDFDSSMGNKARCLDGNGFYACNLVPDVNGGADGGGVYDTINPWLVVLAFEDWYQELIRQTWTRTRNDGVIDRCCEMIASDSALLMDEFEKNYAKWDNIANRDGFDDELSAPARACRNEAQAANFLLRWLNSRVTFLDSCWCS